MFVPLVLASLAAALLPGLVGFLVLWLASGSLEKIPWARPFAAAFAVALTIGLHPGSVVLSQAESLVPFAFLCSLATTAFLAGLDYFGGEFQETRFGLKELTSVLCTFVAGLAGGVLFPIVLAYLKGAA